MSHKIKSLVGAIVCPNVKTETKYKIVMKEIPECWKDVKTLLENYCKDKERKMYVDLQHVRKTYTHYTVVYVKTVDEFITTMMNTKLYRNINKDVIVEEYVVVDKIYSDKNTDLPRINYSYATSKCWSFIKPKGYIYELIKHNYPQSFICKGGDLAIPKTIKLMKDDKFIYVLELVERVENVSKRVEI